MVEEEGEVGEPTLLSAYIEACMEQLGIDLTELHRRSGLGRSTLYGYLSGRMRGDRPRKGTFEKLAKGLEVNVSDIYAVADRTDARGDRRIVSYYRQLRTESDRAEAIESVRRILLRRGPTG